MKATAHTNIALIKYWGKKNTELNLPTTSSLSLTLDKFYTTTSVEPANHDRFILNDQVVDATRVHRFLDILRQQLGDFTPLQVISENHCHTGNNNKTKEQKTLRVSQWTKFILINESNDTVQGY